MMREGPWKVRGYANIGGHGRHRAGCCTIASRSGEADAQSGLCPPGLRLPGQEAEGMGGHGLRFPRDTGRKEERAGRGFEDALCCGEHRADLRCSLAVALSEADFPGSPSPLPEAPSLLALHTLTTCDCQRA